MQGYGIYLRANGVETEVNQKLKHDNYYSGPRITIKKVYIFGGTQG